MKSLVVLPGLILLIAAPAQAQTADQYNRASQALQICGSATGAMIPECAQLRGRMGMSVVAPQDAAAALGSMGLGRGGGSPLSGLGNLGGAGKAAGIASLLGQAIAAARTPQSGASAGPAMPATAAGGQDAAMATYAAGQSYQACVAANPNGWQACMQAMNNNTQAGLLNAGVPPRQLQAAGGYVPPGYAPPAAAAPNPFGSLLPRR